MRKTIPVYEICNIDESSAQRGLMIEHFGTYLEKHYHNLQRPHRHSFHHFVLFTKGKGSHTIDFEKFAVKPFQIYFMIPGQVHSWHFEGGVDGYIVHFNETLFTSFLQNAQYLERFPFFSGNSRDGVCQLQANVHDRVLFLFQSMLEEVKESKELNLDMIRLRLLELFITVDRHCVIRKGKAVPSQKLILLKNFK